MPRFLTDLRATLFHVTSKVQNVTLSLPEPLLRKFRVYAAERNESMTAIMTEAIQKLLEEEDPREAARRRLIARIRHPPNLGTGGVITWSRDELYDRSK